MRIKLILLATLLISYSLKAQDEKRNKGFSYGFEIRYLNTTGASFGSHSQNDVSGYFGKCLRFKAGYFINPHFYTGLSFGADRYEISDNASFSIPTYGAVPSANTFPVTININYYLKDARNTFFAFTEAGPQLSFSEASDKGYVGTLGIGYKFFVSNRTCLAATLGYNYQRSNQ